MPGRQPTSRSKPLKPKAPVEPGAPSANHRAYGSFRFQPEDIDAAGRVKTLLGLELDSQVLRLAIHHLRARVEACMTIEEARTVLEPYLDRVMTVRRGRTRVMRCGPPALPSGAGSVSINP